MIADASAFPVLDPSHVALFERLGMRRRVAPGEYLDHEGDRFYDFWVVLSGAVDIVVEAGGERVITTHCGGRSGSM